MASRSLVLEAPSTLPEVLGSAAFSVLAIHFSLRPFEWVHFRELRRRTGLANRSLQLQLERLRDLDMIRERKNGRTLQSRANVAHQGWGALKAMIRVYGSPVEIYTIGLAAFDGIESATLQRNPGTFTDILDLRVVGEPSPWRDFADVMAMAGALAGYRTRITVAADRQEVESLAGAVPLAVSTDTGPSS